MKKAQEKKMVRNKNEIIRGTAKVGEISKKVQESRLKWYGRRIRRQESDGDGGAGEKKERETKAEGDNIENDLSDRELSGEEAQDGRIS